MEAMTTGWVFEELDPEDVLSAMVLVLCEDGTYGPDDYMDEIEDHARVLLGLDPIEPR